jgi:hypothetical protein|tara:strand:+ start:52 stop:258 length:207 start_codon:yes stop_codon:yes gene_type:complete
MKDKEILEKVYERLVGLQTSVAEAQDEGIRGLRSYIENKWQQNDEEERGWGKKNQASNSDRWEKSESE